MENFKIPLVNFKIREGDVVLEDGCSFDEGKWIEKTTDDFFKGKRVVLFSLPGAFTPTCTSTQLPGFDDNYDKIKSLGVDEIYCCSVNDTFVIPDTKYINFLLASLPKKCSYFDLYLPFKSINFVFSFKVSPLKL